MVRKIRETDDFTELRGPSIRALKDIERGYEPRDIPSVPTANAIVAMTTEYIPEPVHHVGVEQPVYRVA